MRPVGVLLCVLASAGPVQAQFQCLVSLQHLNRQLAGCVVDLTHNHGHDNRIYSALLGMPRDLYVYLPPGYDPCKAYPLVLWLHGAFGDEHAFLDTAQLPYLDQLILRGCCPPMIVACPDGTYGGRNWITATHSFYVNGRGGPVEAHLLQEVLPFLFTHFSIRPEPRAHAAVGVSAGGFGAIHLALKYPEVFGVAVSLAGPVNMRYSNCHGNILEDFDPATYCWKTEFRPREVGGVFLGGLIKLRAGPFLQPVFGPRRVCAANIIRENPADLLFREDLAPGEPALYLSYPGRDNFNFDAHAQSFHWLARGRGLEVTLVGEPGAKHTMSYFRQHQQKAYHWLAQQVLPPLDRLADP
jgi:pimeloyl-ACP methyl ester carboxylesterase